MLKRQVGVKQSTTGGTQVRMVIKKPYQTSRSIAQCLRIRIQEEDVTGIGSPNRDIVTCGETAIFRQADQPNGWEFSRDD